MSFVAACYHGAVPAVASGHKEMRHLIGAKRYGDSGNWKQSLRHQQCRCEYIGNLNSYIATASSTVKKYSSDVVVMTVKSSGSSTATHESLGQKPTCSSRESHAPICARLDFQIEAIKQPPSDTLLVVSSTVQSV